MKCVPNIDCNNKYKMITFSKTFLFFQLIIDTRVLFKIKFSYGFYGKFIKICKLEYQTQTFYIM